MFNDFWEEPRLSTTDLVYTQMSPSGTCLKFPGYHFSGTLSLWQAAPLDAISGFGQKGRCCRVRPFWAFGPAPLCRTIQASLQLWPQHQHLLPEARWLGWTESFILEGNSVSGQTKYARDPHNQTQAGTVVPQGVWTSLIMWLFCGLISCFLTGKKELTHIWVWALNIG